ncbi:cofilin [Orbilia brochopaga]|uniref:Cofilin n=1 Tax=Orbilia brochopaga TaxID=3140254 RepID=A0AAV9U6F4_9PEZI
MATRATVAEECLTAYEDLTQRKAYKYVIYAFNDHNEIIVDQKGTPDASHADFTAELLSTECRYAVVAVDFKRDGEPQSAIAFIDWSPSDAKSQQQTLYADGKAALGSMRDDACVEIYANEPEEVEYSVLLRSLDADEEDVLPNDGLPETSGETLCLSSLIWRS